MKALFDSFYIQRIQLDNHSTNALMTCKVFEQGSSYDLDCLISSTSLNMLFNELMIRDIEINMDEHMIESVLPNGEEVFLIDFDYMMDKPAFLPMLVFPERLLQMRA